MHFTFDWNRIKGYYHCSTLALFLFLAFEYNEYNETMPAVKEVLEFREVYRIFKQGDNKNSIFDSREFCSKVLAIKLDAGCKVGPDVQGHIADVLTY